MAATSGTSSGDGYLMAGPVTGLGVLVLYLQSGNIKEGRQKDYQAWVKKNEASIGPKEDPEER